MMRLETTFLDEVGELSVPEIRFDRQTHTHHSRQLGSRCDCPSCSLKSLVSLESFKLQASQNFVMSGNYNFKPQLFN